MRDIGKVIDQLLVEIPTWETALKENLEWIKSEVPYQAPELHRYLWDAGTNMLQRAFPKPTQDWHFKVLSIWMVLPEDKAREMFKDG